ncbi:hypothetical protein ES703_72743 [subsurface metagenome]
MGRLLSKLGAKRVVHNAVIDGSQIDIVVEQELPTGTPILTIVECKNWDQPVGVQAVNAFAALFKNLHYAKKADEAILVASTGFSAQARQAAESFGIRLLDFDELKSLAAKVRPVVKLPSVEEQAPDRPYVFVLMPFDEKFDDIYYFGIRGAVEDANMICDRADEILHAGGLIERIVEQIYRADILVADMTDHNPNVLYEVGIAHTLGKTVALVVQDVNQIPFDLRNKNHIVYGGKIKFLREKLRALLMRLEQDLRSGRGSNI